MSDKNEAKTPGNTAQEAAAASANHQSLPPAAQAVSTEASHGSGILPPQHWQQAVIISTNRHFTFTPWLSDSQDADDTADVDPALEDNTSSTASIASSILKYRTILGRTFHSEQGDAHYCDFADQFPGCEVIGTDISPIQPSWTPPNLQFQIDDCTKEWTFTEASLDYVHIRFLTGCIGDWEALMKVAYRCLKPGGYIESMEPSAYIQSDDNTIEPDSAMGQWGKIFVEGGSKMGRPFTVVEDELQNKSMEKAGFVDIQEKKHKSPIGSWPKDENLREIGQYAQLSMEQDFEGLILFMTNVLGGWSREEIQVYITHLRREIRSGKKHGWYWQKVVWARKPVSA
ncbi:hypothetical protein LRP88_03922 [Fusarium phalaenopsidis]